MKKRPTVLLAVMFVASSMVVSCGQERGPATAPAPTVGGISKSLLGLPLSLPIVQRLVPLSAPVTWSFVATPLGASSTNLLTGLTVIVPPGAVSAPVTITVTAESGAPVAYDFQPAGMHFNVPITLVQNLGLTTLVNGLLNSNPTGAYFASPTLQYNSATGTGVVNELEPTSTNWLLMQTRVTVSHFSGYTFASCGSNDGSLGGL